MRDKKYSRLVGGIKDENYPSLGGGDKRSEILKFRWNV